jgi:hypothetical protein
MAETEIYRGQNMQISTSLNFKNTVTKPRLFGTAHLYSYSAVVYGPPGRKHQGSLSADKVP